MKKISRSRFIKSRRTRDDIQAVKVIISTLLAEENPMTVRQVFYRLVSVGAIAKTEIEYKCLVVRLLSEMRLNKEIPFDWISDNTRWMRKPRSYGSLADGLQKMQRFYRRDIWNDQPDYVEVWLEKDALAGVAYQVTQEWDVPLMVTRGYSSLSFLHDAAEIIGSIGKPAYIYYLGDHDPSGLDIPKQVERRLREFCPGAEIYFQRIAVTPEQILQYELPTRPTKKTDTRSRGFVGESVEVDALPPAVLRQIVREHIESHIERKRLGRTRRTEAAERDTLQTYISALGTMAQ